MIDVKIRLSALWAALMLTYLLGDVLRIFSGDFEAGEIAGKQVAQEMYLGLAILMMIPVVMVYLSLTLKQPANRWANILIAIFLFGFNLIGLPTYPAAYDRFLIVVGLVFNVLTAWYAWRWISVGGAAPEHLDRGPVGGDGPEEGGGGRSKRDASASGEGRRPNA